MKQRDIDIKSNDNTLFVTEQCNNRCIMCCQPPKRVNDIDLYFAQNIDIFQFLNIKGEPSC